MSTPKVSVVMAVFNGEKYLSQAIESILNQSFNDFEFIIINDCSEDRSVEIVQKYNDERIVLLNNEVNLGLAASLNKGISIAKGEYIARMDDDDIAYPERFSKQVAYLETYPETGVLGSYARLIGDKEGIRKHSTNNEELKVKTLFSCQFCHPTVMIRKHILEENNVEYNEAFKSAQDYELWSRLIHYTQFSTLPEVLLDYRFHEKQISTARREQQLDNTDKIYKSFLTKLKIDMPTDWLQLHRSLASFKFSRDSFSLSKIGDYFDQLICQNNQEKVFPSQFFAQFISEYFYNILKTTKIKGTEKIRLYNTGNFSLYFKPNFMYVKLLLS